MGIHTEGIDLKYRPATYFWAQEHGISLLSDIKGAERRRIYANALEVGEEDLLPKTVTEEVLSEEDRQMLGRVHPAFMGASTCLAVIVRKLKLLESRLPRQRRM